MTGPTPLEIFKASNQKILLLEKGEWDVIGLGNKTDT